jgi:hypothetical protein
MFPNAKIVEEIGRYGGVTGIIFLIFAITVLALSRMKGTPEQKDKRFSLLTGVTFIFGVLALVSSNYVGARGTPMNETITTNKTNGPLSPIIPNNCAPVTITDQSNKPVKR